ncbi:hypothetical protein CC2G_002777 [Coprinopsis cinerea AmutBmut pab1-1]|nr:hypothetical protein CC2G_002777 [Coprinopsis cinerea AmutBmut pab1-1]
MWSDSGSPCTLDGHELHLLNNASHWRGLTWFIPRHLVTLFEALTFTSFSRLGVIPPFQLEHIHLRQQHRALS